MPKTSTSITLAPDVVAQLETGARLSGLPIHTCISILIYNFNAVLQAQIKQLTADGQRLDEAEVTMLALSNLAANWARVDPPQVVADTIAMVGRPSGGGP